MAASTNLPELSPAAKKIVLEARKKFSLVMEDELLDYKHNNPVLIEGCASTLIKIFTNILEHPDEEKYHKVKAVSNTFKNNVAGVRGGEHLTTLAGFKTIVMDLTKYWAFEADEHGIKMNILHDCKGVLEKALRTIHEKAERKRHEHEEKVAREKGLREQALAAIHDDREERKLKTEQQAIVLAEAEAKLEADKAAAEEAFRALAAAKAAAPEDKGAAELEDKEATALSEPISTASEDKEATALSEPMQRLKQYQHQLCRDSSNSSINSAADIIALAAFSGCKKKHLRTRKPQLCQRPCRDSSNSSINSAADITALAAFSGALDRAGRSWDRSIS
eukprot:gene15750-21873_t